jgi:hypothetical protein
MFTLFPSSTVVFFLSEMSRTSTFYKEQLKIICEAEVFVLFYFIFMVKACFSKLRRTKLMNGQSLRKSLWSLCFAHDLNNHGSLPRVNICLHKHQ